MSRINSAWALSRRFQRRGKEGLCLETIVKGELYIELVNVKSVVILGKRQNRSATKLIWRKTKITRINLYNSCYSAL